MTNVIKIIEVINANGRQGPKDLKSREVYNWVKRDLDISYEDYLSVLQANAIPADERMRFRNAYFIVSSSGVYSFFKSSEEELRPYICYIIYKTPYLRSSEIKDRMKEIYPHFTLIDQMLQQNLTAPQCVVDQTIRNVLVSNYERQANRELFERSPVRPYIYTIKPAGAELALQVERALVSGTVSIPAPVRNWVHDQGPALIVAEPYSDEELAQLRERSSSFHYKAPEAGLAEHRERDNRLKATRLRQADYRCSIDESHRSFEAPNMPNFVECHHIVPLAAQREVPDINLDCLENLASMCPVCHSAIHCGTDEVRRDMFERLLVRYENSLQSIGISAEQARELFEKYNM